MFQTRTSIRLAMTFGGVAACIAGSACGGAFTNGDGVGDPDATAHDDSATVPDATTPDARDGGELVVDARADATATDATTGDATTGDAGATDATTTSDGADGHAVTSLLGSAAEFAVFSGAAITNAVATVTTVTGDLGTSPSDAAVGPDPPVVVGSEHLGDPVAAAAATTIASAYETILPANLPCGTPLTGDLGGMTLTPGVYCYAAAAGLTGTLTLDAQNDPDAVWVIQIGSALTTAALSQVVVIHGSAGQACNAYWQITSAATLGASSLFGGNLIVYSAITIGAGTSITGRALAVTALVSMDNDVLSIESCAAAAPVPDGG